MDIPQDLANRWSRFKAGFVRHWGERMEREQDALSELRLHPGFDVLLDTFDAEINALWERWLSEEDPAKAEGIRQQAKATWAMVRMLESRTRAKEVAERRQAEILRLRKASAENAGRRDFLLERARSAQHP